MSLTVNIYYEWHDKPLNGSSHKRTNHIPVVIEIESVDNESIIGTALSMKFTHYTTATPTTIIKVPVVSEATPNSLKATTLLAPTDISPTLTPLPNVPVSFAYELTATFPDNSIRTIAEGMFKSVVV